MLDTLSQFESVEADTVRAEVGSFVCDADPQPIRCGDGHCRRCNCSNWQPQSMDPSTCLCLHSYNDHDD